MQGVLLLLLHKVNDVELLTLGTAFPDFLWVEK